ncbi:uncharacterized protein DUF4397 [Acidovorax sp. 69]|uniref:DUF4397 domain-containing protein n=1 Tax=Acidovorax sp. 69 TaxID=2035202 RepID=UPI000CCB21B3|nr:DUF4397 domain-containing protein [Acidovorax sp. 69]PJI95314.1 uncharacterized protein DUF4397 [Acidovorax sp. 69]
MSHSKQAAPAAHLQAPGRRHLLISALGLVGGSSLLALTGCGGAFASEASVRFINATVDDTQADFYLGSTQEVSKLSNGGAVTSWRTVDAESTQFALYNGGGSSAQLTETRALEEDTYTSVLAYGSLANSLRFRFFAESNASADSGKVKVRLFHAAENLGGLDLYITNTTSLSGLSPTATVTAYGELSDFSTVTSGTYRIRITTKNDQSNVLFDYTTQISLSSTSVHTLVVVPRANGSYPNVSALQEKGDSALLANVLA